MMAAQMGTTTLKDVRRMLPVSGKAMDWNVHAHRCVAINSQCRAQPRSHQDSSQHAREPRGEILAAFGRSWSMIRFSPHRVGKECGGQTATEYNQDLYFDESCAASSRAALFSLMRSAATRSTSKASTDARRRCSTNTSHECVSHVRFASLRRASPAGTHPLGVVQALKVVLPLQHAQVRV